MSVDDIWKELILRAINKTGNIKIDRVQSRNEMISIFIAIEHHWIWKTPQNYSFEVFKRLFLCIYWLFPTFYFQLTWHDSYDAVWCVQKLNGWDSGTFCICAVSIFKCSNIHRIYFLRIDLFCTHTIARAYRILLLNGLPPTAIAYTINILFWSN